MSWLLLSLLVASVQLVSGQADCLRLLGSVACPAFSTAYLSPSNLTNAFPFFATVTDVQTFDAAALLYFANSHQFEQTKFVEELGCSNASNAVIRWERTVLCSMWVNEMWSKNCLALYSESLPPSISSVCRFQRPSLFLDGTSAADSQKMACQSTCLEYSADEYNIVNDTAVCPGPDLTNGNRSTQLVKDFTDCTNWTTLATNNTDTCVLGSTNEGNCGYGTSTSQLCGHCQGASPDDCCYDATAISACSFVLPTRSSSSSAAASATSTPAAAGKKGIHGGALAGAIVGGVIGGLLLLGLLIFLLICCRRRRDKPSRDSGSSFAPAPQTNSFFKNKSSQANPSEKGLLSPNHPGTTGSTPTMGGDTLYAASAANKSTGGVGSGSNSNEGPGFRSSGIVLPRVKDENQNGDRWIETGAEVSVLWPYQAALPDELDLRPGMKLRVLRLYDDAWGTAVVLSGGEVADQGRQGAFPIVCVSEGSSFGASTPSSLGESHTSS
ncbi:hypothetical protein P7C73_g457, partial [Tremellales sp. Uapishka_1]